MKPQIRPIFLGDEIEVSYGFLLLCYLADELLQRMRYHRFHDPNEFDFFSCVHAVAHAISILLNRLVCREYALKCSRAEDLQSRQTLGERWCRGERG